MFPPFLHYLLLHSEPNKSFGWLWVGWRVQITSTFLTIKMAKSEPQWDYVLSTGNGRVMVCWTGKCGWFLKRTTKAKLTGWLKHRVQKTFIGFLWGISAFDNSEMSLRKHTLWPSLNKCFKCCCFFSRKCFIENVLQHLDKTQHRTGHHGLHVTDSYIQVQTA